MSGHQNASAFTWKRWRIEKGTELPDGDTKMDVR
jgi:hypothetical protein